MVASVIKMPLKQKNFIDGGNMSAKILLVDDETEILGMLKQLFQDKGYVVQVATSGEGALQVADETPFDLVLTDYKMPGISGLELAQTLLEQEPDRPVLLMTAYGELQSAQKAIRMGIYEYFTKPLDLHDLVAGIARALERRRFVQEIQAYQKGLEQKVLERTQELQVRVKQLEARDTLLQHLLSIHQPEETLLLALDLVISLCGCDVGTLYTKTSDNQFHIEVATGWKVDDLPPIEKDVAQLILEDETLRALQKAWSEQVPVLGACSGSLRQELGIGSFAMLPVCKGDVVIAVLEVARVMGKDVVVTTDIEDVYGFIPYVVMAIMDSKLQAEPPEWRQNVDAVLKSVEDWADA